MVSADLSGVKLGDNYPVRIMGVINASPESFYKGSVQTVDVAQVAVKMVEEGADIIDIGGMSTAPYLQSEVTIEEETKRLKSAIRSVREVVSVPISVDTPRLAPAE